MRSRLLRGSNQYKEKQRVLKPKTWLTIILVLIVLGILLVPCLLYGQMEKERAMFRDSVTMQKAWAMQPTPTGVELASPDEQAEVIALIQKVWGKDAEIGISIARCESGFRANASNNNSNATQDQGIFQINTIHNMPDMFNATANVSYAYTMYLQQGTTPWDSSKSCWNQ